MDDAVAVALVGRAGGAFGLGVKAAPAFGGPRGIGRERRRGLENRRQKVAGRLGFFHGLCSCPFEDYIRQETIFAKCDGR